MIMLYIVISVAVLGFLLVFGFLKGKKIKMRNALKKAISEDTFVYFFKEYSLANLNVFLKQEVNKKYMSRSIKDKMKCLLIQTFQSEHPGLEVEIERRR